MNEFPRRLLSAVVCAIAIFAAGCHRNNNTSGYGVVWVTLTGGPSNFTSYIVNIDSITLTRNDGAIVTALGTVETVDLSKLDKVAELWGSGTVPTGTYVSASIVLDYSLANISVMVNGVPQRATVVDASGAAVTTQTVSVALDTANPLYLAPTYATTAATRLAVDFNLIASTASINTATNPVTVTVAPYLTAGVGPPDTKLIRVRGPLTNSSVNQGTYTMYVRPFYDDVYTSGQLTVFVDPSTIYTINGKSSAGTAGITQLSQSSTGTTMTAAYTTFEPTATPSAVAGKFHARFVVAGSTLQDVYTQGLEGDVIARSGNTLTLRGTTLSIYQQQAPTYYSVSSTVTNPDAIVTLGPSTIVTADDTTLTGLTSASIAVGQHIAARGIVSVASSNGAITNFDATGTTNTNTGSVRLLPTHLWGSQVASASGALVLNLQTVNGWPVSDFSFAGNGAAVDPSAFVVNTSALATAPDATAGIPLWIDGLVAPFGAAPPDFNAAAVNDELGVQMAGQTAATAAAAASSTNPTPFSCAPANLDCVPASMQVTWTKPGTNTPFSSVTTTNGTSSAVVDLAGASTAVIRVGPESIDMTGGTTGVAVNPTLVASSALPAVMQNAGVSGSVEVTLPPIFLPAYSFGIPAVTTATNILNDTVNVFSSFTDFAAGLSKQTSSVPVVALEARGTYDRAANTFTTLSVSVVL